MIKRLLNKFKKKNAIKEFLKFDEGAFISEDCRIVSKKMLSIGKNSYIGPENVFYNLLAPVYIGDYVMVGPQVMFITGNHRIDVVGEYMRNVGNDMKLPENDQPIIIEDDVWIGARAIILKGVTIGRGSVIAAGAVVTKNVPPYSIYISSSNIRRRFDDETIVEHEKIIKEKYNL